MHAPTIKLNVEGLWENWQRSQRDNNIHRPAVDYYLTQLRTGQGLPAIAIEKLVETDEGEIRIRTADGRHRLTAAHEFGLDEIDCVDTDIANSVKEIFGL